VVTGAKFVATLKIIPLTSTTSKVEIWVFVKPPLNNAPDHGQYYEDVDSSEGFNMNEGGPDLCGRVQERMLSEYGGVGALARVYEQSLKRFYDKYISVKAEACSIASQY